MKYYDVNTMRSAIKAQRAAIKDARLQQDAQRRRMLAVNPNARLATVGGATFVL